LQAGFILIEELHDIQCAAQELLGQFARRNHRIPFTRLGLTGGLVAVFSVNSIQRITSSAAERHRVSNGLQPGDRVLDLRALARSGGMFVGLVAAPLAAGLSGWWWGWCVLAAVGAAVAGFVVAGVAGRVVFPGPPGQAVVARVGPAAIGVALRASVAGGSLITVVCAVAAFIGAGGIPGAITLLAGAGVSVGLGCLAALA
jgi:hypothetical protein